VRIAQVSPLYESVPPKAYGGTERVVHFLTEQLVKNGHEVTLFASGDSVTSAELIAVCERSLRLHSEKSDHLAQHFIQLDEVISSRSKFDVVHFHIDFLHFPASKLLHYHHVTTLHGCLDQEGLPQLYKRYNQLPVISISNSQRTPVPDADWIANVYHGLPVDLFKPAYNRGSYLAFLGRISPEKGIEYAIEAAKQLNIPLKVAAKIDANDKVYFDTKVHALLNHPLIEFLGEINDNEKQDFLSNAIALLFPVNWSEPFGLVLIESIACGTPVIAFRNGSVPEIIDEGITGYIVESVDEMVSAVKKIDRISRSGCRKRFEARFTSEIMVKNYEQVYNMLLSGKEQMT
jgi:glycosyltransferase involved in cell wall biosynthesis